jgi:hypothetical protein
MLKSSLRRLHQMKGSSGPRVSWALNTQINYKFDDVPQSTTALGRVHANYIPKIRLNFTGLITSTAGCVIPRKVLTPALISSIQVQGTELGTPVSSSHMLGGYIDINAYIRSGGKNPNFNRPGVTLAAATPKVFNHTVDIWFGNESQIDGHETAPLALFMQPGEVLINPPAVLSSVDASLADVTISAMTVTCHAVIEPDTEIRIANPWQFTRHRSTAANGSDSVAIQSFGAASTLTGVLSKCGVHSILWAGNNLVGGAAGSGAVASITQFAADFLGLRQNNDPRAIIQELFNTVSDGKLVAGDTTDIGQELLFPFFDSDAYNATNPDVSVAAEVFPILMPVTNFHASKLLDGVGNPSYDLTGTFTPGAQHYTLVEGCYPLSMDKQRDLVAVIQRAHLGMEMFQTDDLELDTKMAIGGTDKLVATASTPKEAYKLTYLPRIVRPRGQAAVA